jgi:hypothetical protein
MLEIFHGDSSWNKPGLHIKGEYPTIKFNDTNANAPDWYIHQNGQSFYILADRDASGEDSPINDSGNSWENPLPFHLNCTTNVLQVFGNEVITEANIVNYTGGGGGGSSGTSEYSSLKLKADNPALVIQDSSGVSAQLISVVSFNDELDTQRGYAGYDSASDGVFKIRNSVGDIFLDSSSFNYKIKNSAGQWKGIIHEGNISSYITSGGGGSSGGGVNDRKTIAMKGYSTSVYIDPSLNVYGVGNSSNTDLINLTSYAALQEGSAPDGTYNGIPAGTYIDVTSYSMFRLVVVFNDYYNNKPPMQLGPRLVTELGTLNGFNTHAGSWYRTNTAHLGHQGVYNPPSNNLYYGANGSTTGTKQYTMEVNSVEEGSNVVRTIETSVVGDNTYPTCGWKGRANYSAGSTPRLYIYFPEAYSTYFLEGIKK